MVGEPLLDVIEHSGHDVEAKNFQRTSEVESSIEKVGSSLTYGLDDSPPWHITLLMAFQLVLSNISACIIIAIISSSLICADAQFSSRIFATSAVMSGITTIFQTLVGVRLPVFQGPTLISVLPYMDARDNPEWRCGQNMTKFYLANNDTQTLSNENAWDEQWRKIQGSLLIAMMVEAICGFTGLAGIISRVIRPITVSVVFILLGVYLWEVCATLAEPHWGIALMTFGWMVIFSVYMYKIQVPVPGWSRGAGFHKTYLPLFELFPILMSIFVSWAITHIITVSGGFSSDPSQLEYQARTDIHVKDISNAPVIIIPYTIQLGLEDFELKYIMIYLACMLASMLESISDYYVYANVCEVSRPPRHAMNRGIIVEGVGGMISAWLGAGHATTSYSNIMGIITITKVGCRKVMFVCGLLMILFGILGKVGAVLVSIPKPVMFGALVLGICFVISSGFTSLRSVDVSQRRNQAILGISIGMSCIVSFWITNTDRPIQTGSKVFNDCAEGLLKMHFIVGAVISIFLDMTLKEDKVDFSITITKDEEDDSVYNVPYINRWIKNKKIYQYLPFLQSPVPSKT